MRASIDGWRAGPNVPDLIDRWLAEGVITPAQADRMRADVGGPGARQPDVRPTGPSGPETALQRSSLVAEGLAYLGGVIVLVAAGLIAARYWESMPENVQLGVVGGTAAGLLLAGRAVPRSRSGAGLRCGRCSGYWQLPEALRSQPCSPIACPSWTARRMCWLPAR